MKKNIIISGIASLLTNLVLFVINLICAYTIHRLPFGITLSGGEYIGEKGFGVLLEKIFLFGIDGNSGGTSEYVRFDFMSLIIPIVILFIIILIISTIISKKKNTNK